MSDEPSTTIDFTITTEREPFDRVSVLTLVDHPDRVHIGTRCVLRDGELILGRASACLGAGVLDHPAVSRNHARLSCNGDSVSISDIDSRNGTYINSTRVTESALSLGDLLSLGPIKLLLHEGPPAHRAPRHPTLAGVGSAIAEVLAHIEQVAPQPITVLIDGETGVGKELVAAEIHRQSQRKGALVAVNCGALSDGVVQSELFGHLRGAFSGAERERAGLVSAARGGTLFFDEIGDASAVLQASLLRLVEQREYRPLGSDGAQHTDARFVAATHVPLDAAVRAGRFRADLHARLSRRVIHMPALRQRPEDILPLALQFVHQAAGAPLAISRSLAVALIRCSWPRNIRQLRDVMEQAVAERGGATKLRLSDSLAGLLVDATESNVTEYAERAAPQKPDTETLRARFRDLGGNVRALANELGVSRNTIYRWFREAGIDVEALRDPDR